MTTAVAEPLAVAGPPTIHAGSRLPAYVPNHLLSVEDLAGLLSVPIETVRMWRRDGALPEPIQLTSKLIRWEPHVIAVWLASRPSAPASKTKSTAVP